MTSSNKEANEGFLKSLFRRKDPDKLIKDATEGEHKLKRTLGAFDLTVLGIGSIIGAGIFTLIGTATAGSPGHPGAGPAIIISFLISGGICALAALCYAELAAMLPVAGSAYTYTYSTLGEIAAWLIGWLLFLEYGIAIIAIASAWSGYFMQMLKGYQEILHLPDWLANPPLWLIYDGGTAAHKYVEMGLDPLTKMPYIFDMPFGINIPALFVIVGITALLYIGIQESARMAAAMVLVKVAIIIVFVLLGAFYVTPDNWTLNFFPNGWNGVFIGAFLVFFSYIGFDAVSTAAEESKNPDRDLPIGIIVSLAVCTLIYILVAAVLTGMVPYNLIDTHAPIAAAMGQVDLNWVAGIISIAAVVGITSVILVQMLGLSRILFAMSRDGLIPVRLSKVHKKFHTPHVITVVLGCLVAFGTFFLDINKAAELSNVGTLAAFAMVCAGVVILRYKDPDRRRPFKTPFFPVVPILGCICCLGLILYTLFFSETPLVQTLIMFSSWMGFGVLSYFVYGRRNSTLGKELANNAE